MARHGTARHGIMGVFNQLSPKDFLTAMKISDEILIDLNAPSDEGDSETLTNVENLIHLLQSSISAIAHAYEPKLTFTRKDEGTFRFRCWIEAGKGVYIEPQLPTIMTNDSLLDPYRSAACLIMVQFFNWNKDYPTTGESLEIPILFR
jgi:hypothetical protein